jgi:type I restriction enzyme S subunit
MIPLAGWHAKCLTELADYINGYAFKPDDWKEEGLPIVRIEQLRNPDGPYDYCDRPIPPSNIIDDGELIFSWSASLLLRIWRHGRAALNQHLFKVVEREGLDRLFLKAFIEFHLPALTAASHGSTMQHITRKEMARFSACLPASQVEQSKIAEVLWTVDSAIAQTEALISKQQRINVGLMQDVLSRGIDEQGRLRSEGTHKFKNSILGKIPDEWEIVELQSIAEAITSGSRGWAQYYSIDGDLFLRIGNLTREHINLRLEDAMRVSPPTSAEGQRTAVSPGDLLISITADLGIIGVIPDDFETAYVNQHIALVRLSSKQVDPRFVGWFLSGRQGQTQFQQLNESGAKAGLNLPTVGRLLVPLMDISEQSKIASCLDASTRRLDDERQCLQKLQSLRAALMQDLLTGKKRVTTLLESVAEQEKKYALA